MRNRLIKITLAGAIATLLMLPFLADARSNTDDGVTNASGAFGYGPGSGSNRVPVINSRQGIQGTPANADQVGAGAPNFSGTSSGPGLENKRSRLKKNENDTK
jgi:hypothetical protein